jgi:hypothetical protein
MEEKANFKILHKNKLHKYSIIYLVAIIGFFTSCSTIEKASMHGFKSGYYKLESDQQKNQKVYVDVTNENIDIYNETDHQPDTNSFMTIPLSATNNSSFSPLVFRKNSLDIDITSIILKYRPGIYGLPDQMTTDFNAALYAGWRHDSFKIKSRKDPLGKSSYEISNRGYDIGCFAGPGAALISPFSTQQKTTDEYNGMVIQAGIAGFIETNIASFGIAVGLDYLLNPDRKIWIYNNQPWYGFIIGIALN